MSVAPSRRSSTMLTRFRPRSTGIASRISGTSWPTSSRTACRRRSSKSYRRRCAKVNENGHPAFTRAYKRTFDNATFPELTREVVRNNERYGGEGSAHWTWEEIQNSLLFNDRERIENLSEREQRTLALFMNESDEIAAQFGEAIERHWQGLSGGEYLAASMENATAGAMVDLSTGQPFVSTAAGVFSGPFRAQVEYQVDKRLPKDYRGGGAEWVS
ncbi:hypothetical protein [Natrialba sp. INN-245]|uniref:hypothetical protein n=1 Tax=Natrialba sp. INN-245 TaxID=2690967 RepID=UPI001F171A70|nr:hypothetical protein [Natrialba sp. INN-245]